MIRNRKDLLLKNSRLIDASEDLIKVNDRLIEMNRKLINDKEERINKEHYLLNAINDSMKVKEPKRFLIHRMSLAPFEPVDYTVD